jgi:hypothetical protein
MFYVVNEANLGVFTATLKVGTTIVGVFFAKNFTLITCDPTKNYYKIF